MQGINMLYGEIQRLRGRMRYARRRHVDNLKRYGACVEVDAPAHVSAAGYGEEGTVELLGLIEIAHFDVESKELRNIGCHGLHPFPLS
jgi:hypothetical protein